MSFDFSTDDKLLGIDDICEKLSISRTTFERLRDPRRRLNATNALLGSKKIFNKEDDYAGMPQFPEPAITLGRSPRWSAQSLNDWIAQAK